jgi:hypothetical protein
MAETSTALTLTRPSEAGLTMVVEPSEAEQRLHALQDFVRRNMVEGEDFGVIPGTKGQDGKPPKKTLLQPGAQKLAEIYGLAVTFEDARPPIERWDGEDPMFAYFKLARVSRRTDGAFLGSGMGSCNSREKKYAARWVFERDVPPHLDIDRLPKREGKAKGSGKPFVMYKVPNPEIFDLVNTIEKMACKRALVGAVIAVTRSAGIFTQDMEDAVQEPPARNGGEVIEAEFEEPRRAAPSVVDPAIARRAADALTGRMSNAPDNQTLDALRAEIKTIADEHKPRVIAALMTRRIGLALTPAMLDDIESKISAAAVGAEACADLLALVKARRVDIEVAQAPAE